MSAGATRILALRPEVPEGAIDPAWLRFIRLCRELRYGEIEKLVIQDGLPVLAETVKKKVKFT